MPLWNLLSHSLSVGLSACFSIPVKVRIVFFCWALQGFFLLRTEESQRSQKLPEKRGGKQELRHNFCYPLFVIKTVAQQRIYVFLIGTNCCTCRECRFKNRGYFAIGLDEDLKGDSSSPLDWHDWQWHHFCTTKGAAHERAAPSTQLLQLTVVSPSRTRRCTTTASADPSRTRPAHSLLVIFMAHQDVSDVGWYVVRKFRLLT